MENSVLWYAGCCGFRMCQTSDSDIFRKVRKVYNKHLNRGTPRLVIISDSEDGPRSGGER